MILLIKDLARHQGTSGHREKLADWQSLPCILPVNLVACGHISTIRIRTSLSVFDGLIRMGSYSFPCSDSMKEIAEYVFNLLISHNAQSE
jgi:hypothetical protein